MEMKELAHIAIAVLMMFVVSAFAFVFNGNYLPLVQIFIFSVVIVAVPIVMKKAVAYSLDSRVEHSIWNVQRYGFRERDKMKTPLPFGVIVPIIFTVFSSGIFKIMTFLTYDTQGLKHRAARKFSFYSYTEMTDWHNGLIGAVGVLTLWIIAIIGYLPGWEFMAKMAVYYAFWNMVPIAKLDGTQIYFGSRVLWAVFAVITLIFAFYAFIL